MYIYYVKSILFIIPFSLFFLCNSIHAQEKNDSLINSYHSAKYDTTKIISLHQYIPLNYTSPDSAIKYSDIAINLSRKIDDIALLAKSYNLKAISYYYNGNFNESQVYLNKSLVNYSRIKNKKGMASCYNGMGVVYFDQGKLYKSLEYGIKALRIKEKIGDKKSVAMTLNNVGNVYKDLGKFEKALEFYDRSIKIKEKIDDFHGLAMTYNNLGLLYHSEEEYEVSKKYYSLSLIMKRKIGDLYGEAMTVNNIGLLYESQKSYEQAIPYYEQSIILKKQIGDQYGLAMSLINLATVYREMGSFNKCFEKLNKAEKIAKEIGYTTQLRSCYQRLYETHEMRNNTSQAYKYYKLYIEVKDSLMGEESIKNIEELQAKYEDETKQLTIQNLSKKSKLNKAQLEKNRAELKSKNITNLSLIAGLIVSIALVMFFFVMTKQRTKMNEALEKSLAEKEVLFREVHHRVKNNFQVISSLLNLHANNSDNKAVQKALGEAKDRVGSMALVHEKLYQSKDLTQIKMDDYTSQLIMHLTDSFDDEIEFASILKIEGVYLDIETAIPLGLIFNELITNSIKYAFKEKSNNTIEIEIKKIENKIAIEYKDNGIGLPESFDLDNLESLGLNLVQILVLQIHGELMINTDNGTSFSFEFELPE